MNEELQKSLDAASAKVRAECIAQLIGKLSKCGTLLDLPPELIREMLSIDPSTILSIWEAIAAAGSVKQCGSGITLEETKEAVDLAKVAHLMEEETPETPVISIGLPYIPLPYVPLSGPEWVIGGDVSWTTNTVSWTTNTTISPQVSPQVIESYNLFA